MATAISGLRKARAPSALAEASGQALLAVLAHAEFLPQVIHIERVVHEATWSEWHVVMDRGARRFVVDKEDHIRRLEDGHHVIADSFGMRILVPAPEKPDAHSRRWPGRHA